LCHEIRDSRSIVSCTLGAMTHAELITSLAGRIRVAGPDAALTELRSAQTPICDPDGVVAVHDTLAVFYMWAVDRLVSAGLTDLQVVWHPLVDTRSPRAWWDDTTLRSDAARTTFVPSTLARAGEPSPVEIRALAAA
jgi:hypothetical protein